MAGILTKVTKTETTGEESEFRTGDLVRLKSGGPAMTVSGVDAEYKKSISGGFVNYEECDFILECRWFDSNGLHRERFLSAMLRSAALDKGEKA